MHQRLISLPLNSHVRKLAYTAGSKSISPLPSSPLPPPLLSPSPLFPSPSPPPPLSPPPLSLPLPPPPLPLSPPPPSFPPSLPFFFPFSPFFSSSPPRPLPPFPPLSPSPPFPLPSLPPSPSLFVLFCNPILPNRSVRPRTPPSSSPFQPAPHSNGCSPLVARLGRGRSTLALGSIEGAAQRRAQRPGASATAATSPSCDLERSAPSTCAPANVAPEISWNCTCWSINTIQATFKVIH